MELKQLENDNLWINKYMPTKLNEIVGNKKNIKKICDWLSEFNNIDKKKSPILIIEGHCGCGKTLISKLAFKQFNYNMIHINVDMDNKSKLSTLLDKALKYKNIMSMFHKNKKTAILIDNIDELCKYSNSSYNLTEILQILNIKKNKINIPVICTAVSFKDKRFTKLKNETIYVKLNKINNIEIIDYIEKFTKSLNINIDIDASIIIANNINNDIRRLIYMLHDIIILNKLGANDTITLNMIETTIDNFGERKYDEQLFDITNKFFNCRQNDTIIYNYLESDNFLLPLMIHENYINELINRNIDDNKLKQIVKDCSTTISIWDIINSYIFKHQFWEFFSYGGILIKLSIYDEFKKHKKLNTKKTNIKFTSLLNKESLSANRKKKISKIPIMTELSLFPDELKYIAEYISTCLKYEKYKDIVTILKQYNIDISKICDILKVCDNKDMIIKITSKIKKKIINAA